MATVDSNFFELQRRAYQWNRFSTLDDGSTSLLYDANPNLAVNGNTPGETKLISLPIGGFYVTSTGVLYFKNAMPNTWSVVSLGSAISGPIFQTYPIVSPAIQWIVVHNQGTTEFIKNIFDSTDKEIFASVTIIDNTSFKVDLTEASTGKVCVIFPPA